MMNTISILGSTGSIGRQTLDVAEQLGLQVAALTAHASIECMEEQARRFRPRLAVLTDEAAEQAGLPVRRVLSALTVLEIDGYAQRSGPRSYVRTVRLHSEKEGS